MSASTLRQGLWMTGLAAFLMAGTPILAHALPVSATPSISVEQAYDSNVFDDRTGNEQDDYILRIRPAVSIAYPAVDTAVILELSAESATYYNNPDLSRPLATWRGALSSVRPILLSPNVSMTPMGYYLETYESSRRSQLVFSPTAPAIPIEIAQFAQTHTRDYGGSVFMNYQAATRFRTALTGAYNKHEILTDNTGLTDYYTYTGDLSISYLSGPRSTIGIFGSASDTTYSNDTVATTYGVGLLGSYAFSEFLRMDARVGASFLRNKPGSGLPESTDQSPTASLSLTYRVRDFFASAWGSYGYSSGSSFGETTRQLNAGASLGDQFANGWWWALTGAYQANRNIDSPSASDMTSGTGTAEIRYVPAPWATLRLSGTHSREWVDSGSDLKKTTAFLGITLSNTYNLY
jgi:hypothetical protein